MKHLATLVLAIAVFFGPAFSQKKDTYKVRTVVIDPGHGGVKPGAAGSRSMEKDITLSVALKFGQLIQDNYPEVKVIYTRNTDVDVSLAERAHIANRNKADLFVSIHANSHPTSSPTGVETFVMGLSESKANLEVARKENADILLEADYRNNSDYQGFDPSAPETYVMLSMFQSAFIDKSLNFAQTIQNQYKQNIKTINRGVKQAELFVLYKTSMPSVLTEIGFISNPNEEAYMLSDEGQATIAICLFNAFMDYKLAEDGTAKPANPVIRLKGYVGAEQETAASQTPVAQTNPTPSTTTTTTSKPVPSVEMPRREPVAEQQTLTEAEARARQQAERQAAAEADAAEKAKQQADRQAAAEAEAAAKAMQQAEKQAAADALAKAKLQAAAKPAADTVKTDTIQKEDPGRTHHTNGLVLPRNTASTDRRFYTVQFLLSDRVMNAGARELAGIDEFDVIRKSNGLAYCCGRFATFQEASNYCNQLRAATPFKDAWPFECKLAGDEQPVAVAKVKRPHEPTPLPSMRQRLIEAKAAPEVQYMPLEEETTGVSYRIQFLISTREMKRGDPDLCGITDIVVEKDGSMYKYLAGYYETRREAEQRCAGIKVRTPFKDAFIVAYKDGKRVR